MSLSDRFRRVKETKAARNEWSVHEERGGGFAAKVVAHADVDGYLARRRGAEFAWQDELIAQPPEVLGSVLLLLVRRASEAGAPWYLSTVTNDLIRKRWTISESDALLAGRVAAGAVDEWGASWALSTAATMLRKTFPDMAAHPDAVEVVRGLLAGLDSRRRLQASDRNGLRTRLRKLVPAEESDVLDLSGLHDDGWANEVAAASAMRADPRVANAVLTHLLTASGSKPSAAWARATRDLVAAPAAEAVLRVLLDRLAHGAPGAADTNFGRIRVVIGDRNADVARAAVWAASAGDAGWAVPLLREIALRSFGRDVVYLSEKVPNAAIATLGDIGTPEAIVALQRCADATKNAGFRKRIAAALRTAADAAGLTPSQLVERTVPDLGFSAEGVRTFRDGDVRVRVRLTEDATAMSEWEVDGSWVTKPGTAATAEHVSAMKRVLKETRDGVAAERRRIEGLLASGRSWDVAEWRSHYVDHPVTGRIARRLIWTFADGTEISGLPDGPVLRTPHGERPVPESGTVRLWHPLLASTDEVEQWRAWLLEHEIVQPFKQAYREVYLLTPAEEETRTYSNRFASHVVRYQQMYALFKERGWPANYLGPYDGGYEGTARQDLADARLTVAFGHFALDADDGGFGFASTDRVWFYRLGDRAKEPIPLVDIPPLVFSETFRDVDLFVSVTSIALDPLWADRGTDPHFAYWSRIAFGELTEAAKVRRDVLARIVPMLAIADRLEVADRFLRVQGKRFTYKVHIGSGNIQIEPDDRYLCIVPKGASASRKVMLPFEGDTVLSVVLSKAVMLAADDKIKDPTILSQLARRG